VLATAARDSDARRLERPRHLEQLGTFGSPRRDPRGRVVSVSYIALLPCPTAVTGGAAWHPALDPPPLAFDHATILSSAVDRLRAKLTYSNVAYGLLPDTFTLSELQAVYEAVLGRELDKRNFRRKVTSLGLLQETGAQRRGSHRPAQLYRFAAPGLVLLDDVITA
jgi:8-oxo-dGTP diphosphatase